MIFLKLAIKLHFDSLRKMTQDLWKYEEKYDNVNHNDIKYALKSLKKFISTHIKGML